MNVHVLLLVIKPHYQDELPLASYAGTKMTTHALDCEGNLPRAPTLESHLPDYPQLTNLHRLARYPGRG